jgi:hypothetical protein
MHFSTGEEALGAWGPALFSDDTACDVRDEYRDLIADGVDDAEATQQVLRQWPIDGNSDDVVIIWVALAVTQSKLGRLDPAVAARALELIDNGGDLDRWAEEGPKKVAQRRAALDKAREQLTGPQPSRRQLRHPTTTLQPGDVLDCPTRDGRHILLRVVRIHRGVPVVRLLFYAGQEIPPLDEIARLPDYQHVNRHYEPDGYAVPFTMHKYKRVDYPQGGYSLLGNIGARPEEDHLEGTGPMVDWQAYLPDYALVGHLIDKWDAAAAAAPEDP